MMKKQWMTGVLLACLSMGYPLALLAEETRPVGTLTVSTAPAAPATSTTTPAPTPPAPPPTSTPPASTPPAPPPASTPPAPPPAVSTPPAPASQAPLPTSTTTATLGDVTGTYDVLGQEALNKDGYHGVATVTKNRDVYTVKYQDDEATVFGVGLTDGNLFSIAYVSEGTPAILILKGMPDGTLKGPWAYKGENVPSHETWKRR